MGRPAKYEVLGRDSKKRLVIRDVGPWDKHFTVTNDAERVIAELLARGLTAADSDVLYYDSGGDLDIIKVRGGKFDGFAFLPPSDRPDVISATSRPLTP